MTVSGFLKFSKATKRQMARDYLTHYPIVTLCHNNTTDETNIKLIFSRDFQNNQSQMAGNYLTHWH